MSTRKWFAIRPAPGQAKVRRIFIYAESIPYTQKVYKTYFKHVGFKAFVIDGPFLSLREASSNVRASCRIYGRVSANTSCLEFWRRTTITYIPKVARHYKASSRDRRRLQTDAANSYCVCGDSAYVHIKRPGSVRPEWGGCVKYGCTCNEFVEKPLTPPKPPATMASSGGNGGGISAPPPDPKGLECTCGHKNSQHLTLGRMCTVGSCYCTRFITKNGNAYDKL